MVASATSELDKSVGADFIVAGNQRVVPQAEQAMEKTPGLAHVTRYKVLDATLTSPDGKADDKGVTAADPTYADDLRRTTTEGNLKAAYGDDAMSVGSDYAKKHGVHVGDTITVASRAGRPPGSRSPPSPATTAPSTRARAT